VSALGYQVPHQGRAAVHARRGGRVAAGNEQLTNAAVPANASSPGGTRMIAHRLYVGTIGEGMFRSLDGGVTFRRACENMFVECHVRALAVHPRQPATLYLGSEQGLFISTDAAESWTKLPAPLDGLQVWSLWVAPRRPEVLLAGTCPSHLFRSEDGGRTWSEASATLVRECPRLLWTRVTCLAGDPDEENLLWAGVEIDGVHQSRDGGRTWRPIGSGLSSRDIHALVVVPGQAG